MTSVVVVGGGVLGTMHALMAHRAGADVVHLERDAEPRSASVRNFGLVWVSGRADGEELAAAQRARELWEEIGDLVPATGFRAHGSLTVALNASDRKVMEGFAATTTAAARGITFVDAGEVRARNPVIAGDVHGGLWCERDAIVEPGQVLPAVRGWLDAQGGYRFLPGRIAVEATGGCVIDHTGVRHRGDLAVLCTGDAHTALGRDLPAAPLRRVRLQMMQTAPFAGRLTTPIADADSLRYYPAYGAAGIEDLSPQDPVAAANHMQLLLVQRLSGGLTIGDTHAYDEPFDFAVDEEPYTYLVRRAECLLGCALPRVVRRWAGVYSQCTDEQLCYRTRLDDGLWYVTGVGGRGMTCSPAVAETTWQLAGLA